MDTITALMPGERSNAVTQLLDILRLLAPAALAILSAYLAYAFARRQASDERQRAFILRQITDFYSPMVGLRSSIRALSHLRADIEGLADVAWTKTIEEAPRGDKELTEHLQREFRPFDRLIEYNNRQLREDLLPRYERMLQVFTDQYWLAEPDTRAHFDELTKFVELWRRHLDESLPDKVLAQVKHSEAELEPLYQNLATTLGTLTARLKTDRAA